MPNILVNYQNITLILKIIKYAISLNLKLSSWKWENF